MADVKRFNFGDHGLAEVLKDNWLKVPLNQREYKWEDSHVRDMLQDLSDAIDHPERGFYFMGSIVLTKHDSGEWSVTDGQQRLATTTMMLCAIRDIVLEKESADRASGIETECIYTINPDTAQKQPKLRMNADDHDFFFKRIVLRPSDRVPMEPQYQSHKRLQRAFQLIVDHFRGFEAHYGKTFIEALNRWRKYLLDDARVLVLKAADSHNAFVLFRTMNHRGIRTSEVDVVKNHIFEQAGKRIDEAQKSWSLMRGVIESLADEDNEDDLVLDFVKCACCVKFGNTRERQIFDRISERSKGDIDAVTMASSLESMANDYAAISNPEHPKWNKYKWEVRSHLRTLLDLKVKQMRPLILSIAQNFSDKELSTSYGALSAWVVRLNVAGGSKVGRLDDFYATLAHRVNAKKSDPLKIKNYKELLTATDGKIPGDAEFMVFFERTRVKVGKLARYYLRELERAAKGTKEPALTVNPDESEINLEHVMPDEPCEEWAHVSKHEVEAYGNMIGNLALMQASKNVIAARAKFQEKAPMFAQSKELLLTEMIGTNFKSWGPKEIESRGKELAKYAPEAWPLEP
jgi:hypothetical protein